MNRTALVIIGLLLSCAACFGQSTFEGLTPGRSTRAEAERVLGLPVKKATATLAEYKPRWNADKLFVQYSNETPAGVVERIELTCAEAQGAASADTNSGCNRLHFAVQEKYSVNVYMSDALKQAAAGSSGTSKHIYYFGQPRFMVFTEPFLNGTGRWEIRWSFYSKELFEAAAPEPGCHGLLMLGVWETNRGRMSIAREGVTVGSGLLATERVRGTYSANNGTFTGLLRMWTVEGEWKDATGTGTMQIHAEGDGFTGEWKRTTGRGPREGKWEGRCVETNTGGS
ncbi:MAG: hypothetical protein QOJ64_3854 [Acidobacteriota bacterium]|jgi:hypothetical protein|nr:hypothetical protein [Acidobacteriota bacterium]